MKSRRIIALLGLAVVLSACGGAPDTTAGKHTASQIRRSAAVTYWQFYHSLGTDVTKPAGQGGFVTCGAQNGTSLAYTIKAMVGPRSHGLTAPAFVTALAAELKNAGWRLAPAGENYQVTRSGVRAVIGPPPPGFTLTAAQVTVTSKCADVGAAASTLRRDYQNNTDKFEPGGPQVPTGFPSP